MPVARRPARGVYRLAPRVPRWAHFATHRFGPRRPPDGWFRGTAIATKGPVTRSCRAGTARLGPPASGRTSLRPIGRPPHPPRATDARDALGWDGMAGDVIGTYGNNMIIFLIRATSPSAVMAGRKAPSAVFAPEVPAIQVLDARTSRRGCPAPAAPERSAASKAGHDAGRVAALVGKRPVARIAWTWLGRRDKVWLRLRAAAE